MSKHNDTFKLDVEAVVVVVVGVAPKFCPLIISLVCSVKLVG